MTIGEGSQNSPIFISDDEDEEIRYVQQLVTEPEPQPPRRKEKDHGLPGPFASPSSNGENRKRKRKRDQPQSQFSASASHPPKKNKKSRYRDRDLHRPIDVDAPSTSNPDYLSYSYYDHDPYEPRPEGGDPYYRRPVGRYDDVGTRPYEEQSFSSSDWVNSMARAADDDLPGEEEDLEQAYWQDQSPSYGYTFEYDECEDRQMSPPLPLPPPPPVTLPRHPLPPPPVSLPPPPAHSHHTSSKHHPINNKVTSKKNHTAPVVLPPIPLIEPMNTNNSAASTPASLPLPLKKIIGMPSDRDTSGTRSSFKISPTTIFDFIHNHKFKYPHIPGTSCTLIMDQLPKQNRDPAWIKSWCERAAGALPVFYAIDPSSAKALIEFSSHAVAKKAWGSPKLGEDVAVGKSVPMKGIPREDLIRVWWFHPKGGEVKFDKTELEEGEIEDVRDDVKVLSKKERKAKAAKEKAVAKAQEERDKKQYQEKKHDKKLKDKVDKEKPKAELPPPLPTSPSVPAASSYQPITLLPPPPSMIFSTPSYTSQWTSHYYNQPPTGLPLPPLPPLTLASQSQPSGWPTTPAAPPETNEVPDHSEDDRMSIDEAQMELESSPIEQQYDRQIDLKDEPVGLSTSAPMKALSISTLPTPTPTPPEGSVPVSPVDQSVVSSHVIMDISPPPSLPIPSEPRAMKNAPTEPTYTRRNRELEERIARGRAEMDALPGLNSVIVMPEALSMPMTVPSGPAPMVIPQESAVPVSTQQAGENADNSKQAMEDRLRSLVLASRKAKGHKPKINGTGGVTTVANSTAESVPPPVKAPAGSATPTLAINSLDDLAVSFITETIQTLKPATATAQVSAVDEHETAGSSGAPSRTTTKLRGPLADLESQIAESKALMEALVRAKGKEEKDAIMARLRILSGRTSSTDSKSKPNPTHATARKSTSPHEKTTKSPTEDDRVFAWPESVVDGGMLIVSDDEDEDEDE
ncbi:hypothetical protein VNI00_006600 [Paramarasmius palmivorus]|uniref:Uncharacterized protein n=1 Tax=Paramarasmius palmivorus TaxID=297713 RepID=A0AAW0D9F5_9AGAR